LYYHLIDIIFKVSLIVFIGKAQAWVFLLEILQKGEQLLNVSLALFALAGLNVDDHMINLLKTHVCGVLLADQGMNLVNRDLALNIELDLSLNVLVVDVRALFDIELMRMVHHHATRTDELLPIGVPFESNLNRAV
jgi:hypothetical protein